MKYSIAIVEEGATKFRVTIADGNSKTSHLVSVRPEDVAKYAPGARTEALLRASFEFLLAREPKESILREFALPDIEKYFPDFRSRLKIST
ncbi:MAG: hypothetical protein WA823_17440 [Candidatus Acidiferrales bacterium]